MEQIFTLEQVVRVMVENISGAGISKEIKQNVVNRVMLNLSENQILENSHVANCPFKKVGQNEYKRFTPYFKQTRGKRREFKRYLHYHD